VELAGKKMMMKARNNRCLPFHPFRAWKIKNFFGCNNERAKFGFSFVLIERVCERE
jgi:hypothetical protein